MGAVAPETRLIAVGSVTVQGTNAPSTQENAIRTTKYSWITFLPKGLFEQFRRVANVYFLFIAALSCTPVSPVNPYTNVFPLVVVLAISMFKEAVEDRKRRASDVEVNNSIAHVLRGGVLVDIPWQAVHVGDILRVEEGNIFPADLILLGSGHPEGVCYIETMNLDGETNLKLKKALPATQDFAPEQDLDIPGTAKIECEQPNNSLYTFTGNIILDGQRLALSTNQVLLRGCMLRNTRSIYGVAIFTGHSTKIMMNSTGAKSKRSSLERHLDHLIVCIFAALGAICIIDAVASALWINTDYWYLRLGAPGDSAINRLLYDPSKRFIAGILDFLTLVTLYSSLIPISLYVSIEAIKFFQAAQLINADRSMYHEESDTPARCRTSNLNEELGQIQCILSDKTGTLTCNRMEFFKCSIAGVKYGRGITEIERSLAQRAGQALPEAATSAAKEDAFNFDDERLMHGNWRQSPDAVLIREFMRLMAICHTVIPEGPPTPHAIKYQAGSPDEAALVVAAKVFGAFFHARSSSGMHVLESHPWGGSPEEAATAEYEVLAVLEFNSTRKRQSCVVRHPNGTIVLYCKGADTVIFERLSKEGQTHVEATLEHLEEFGNQGLRTLCMAYRVIPPEEYEEWAEVHFAAKTAMQEREARLDAAAELIENDLVLLGATGIEDKLQQGVSEAIEQLQAAGLRIWMLTGDKMETAINIGYACSLLSNSQCLIQLSVEAGDAAGEKQIAGKLTEGLRVARCNRSSASRQDLAVVIDGQALAVALQPPCRQMFVDLGLACKVVVCCRVSPLQKAQVTQLVRCDAGLITLSVGDGANDVSMIQAAHVGIGISGQEGMQAVMAADFSIAQFSYLTRLLLVHGHWCYTRMARVVGYFFYKNAANTLTQFWFNLATAFSGQRLYDDWCQAFYNLLFTCLPVLVVGLFDQDVSQSSLLAVPQLYAVGQSNAIFRPRVLGIWVTSALWHSLVCFYAPALALTPSAAASRAGNISDLWALGVLVYTVVIVVVNVRLALSVHFHTMWHYVAIYGSIAIWAAFLVLYSLLPLGFFRNLAHQETTYRVFLDVFSWPAAWLCFPLCLAACLLPHVILAGATRAFQPHDTHVIQEYEKELDRLQPTRTGTNRVYKVSGPLLSSHLSMPHSSAGATQKVAMQDAAAAEEGRGGGADPLLSKSLMISLAAMAGMDSLPAYRRRRAHTGYDFDHPGFESWHSDEAQRTAEQLALSSSSAPRRQPRPRRYTACDDALAMHSTTS